MSGTLDVLCLDALSLSNLICIYIYISFVALNSLGMSSGPILAAPVKRTEEFCYFCNIFKNVCQ